MLNECKFIGNLGRDPEIRFTQSGNKVANFSIAVTEKWKDKSGDKKEQTEWVRVVVFSDGLCGVVEKYLKKGSKVYISGAMQTRSWDDTSGITKYSTEIVLNGFNGKLIMLDSKTGHEKKPEDAPQNDDLDDEIPF